MPLTPEEMSAPWYVVFSKPRQEQRALQQLLRQEYEVYLPMLTQWRRKAGTWQSKVAPMFPRYMFLRQTRMEQGIGPVRSTLGVSGFVRFGVEIARVSPSLITAIHDLEVSQAQRYAHPPGSRMSAGTRVRVEEGPFAGLEGIVKASAQQRVIILLDILGKEASVKVERDAVRAA